MRAKPEEIVSILREEIQNYDTRVRRDETGTVLEVGDGIATVYGLDQAVYGELVELDTGVKGMVMNLARDSVGVVLLGSEAGFAAILGTGTNSCLYNGERITQNIDSLGFILGDEGSGGYLGKRLISDFIRGEMPEKARLKAATVLGGSGDELIDRIYTQPFPNRFCAQYSRFIGENLHSDPYFLDLVLDSFRAFFRNIVSRYPHYRTCRFNCVGSVGYAFRDILKIVAEEFGMETGRILQAPMERLIDYHTNRKTTSNP